MREWATFNVKIANLKKLNTEDTYGSPFALLHAASSAHSTSILCSLKKKIH
jgi:hypothetical protein